MCQCKSLYWDSNFDDGSSLRWAFFLRRQIDERVTAQSCEWT